MKHDYLMMTSKRTMMLLALTVGCSLSPLGVIQASAAQITQQSNVVKGHVVDPTGEPIIGATVKVKGSSSAGAITDLDG